MKEVVLSSPLAGLFLDGARPSRLAIKMKSLRINDIKYEVARTLRTHVSQEPRYSVQYSLQVNLNGRLLPVDVIWDDTKGGKKGELITFATSDIMLAIKPAIERSEDETS